MKDIKINNVQVTEAAVDVVKKFQDGNCEDGWTEFVLDKLDDIEVALLESEWCPTNAMDLMRVLHDLEKDIRTLARLPKQETDEVEG